MQPFQPLVAIVNFHHLRGPEIESWFGLASIESAPPQYQDEWNLLPFLALPDGAHANEEEISYFTLKNGDDAMHKSLFGISCTRSLAASLLNNKSSDVTRSAVQKAVVAILPSPGLFRRIREKLSAVTKAWFAQANFDDHSIVQSFWEDLKATTFSLDYKGDSMDDYVGLSLRQIVNTWRNQFLVLFKAVLLQKRVLFYGSHCEELCLLQFSLVSLIPGLIKHLDDCAGPSLSAHASSLESQTPPTSLRTTSRASLLAYMGLPLQIFGGGAMFGPYVPLQQLPLLEDIHTKSFLAGTTNALLLRRPPEHLDILVNLDLGTVDLSDELKQTLSLTPADKQFINLLVASVTETWDEQNPGRPTTHGYAGSEEWIRLQFEEYLLGFLGCVSAYSTRPEIPQESSSLSPSPPSDPDLTPRASSPEVWKETAPDMGPNAAPWNDFSLRFLLDFLDSPACETYLKLTALSRLPVPIQDLSPPRHPCASPNSPLALALSQIQSDLSARLAGLQLDAKFARASENLNRRFGEGRERVGAAVASFWHELESRRIARELERANAEIERDAMVTMQRAKQRELAAAVGRPVTPGDNDFKRISRDTGSIGGSPASAPGSVAAGASRRTSSGVHTATTNRVIAETAKTNSRTPTGEPAAKVALPSFENAGQRASAYLASWSAWAAEKRRGPGSGITASQGSTTSEGDVAGETLHSNHGSIESADISKNVEHTKEEKKRDVA